MILTEMITGVKNIVKLLTGQCVKVKPYEKEVNDYKIVQAKKESDIKIREIDLNMDRGQVIVKETLRIVDDAVADAFLEQNNINKKRLTGYNFARSEQQYKAYDNSLKYEFKIVPVKAGGELYYVGTNLKNGFVIMDKEAYKLIEKFNLKLYGSDNTLGIHKLVDSNSNTVAYGINTKIDVLKRDKIFKDAKKVLAGV